MNLTQNPSLIEQLAASYALGTLRGGARRRFEALARNHATVRAAALVWQGRLSSLAELEPEIAPSPVVWKRIENLINAEKQAGQMQAARAQAAVAVPTSWWSNLGLWRGVSAVGVTAALVAIVAGANLASVNTRLGSQVASLGGQVKDLTVKLAATPEIQYVAVLADDKANASILVTFDPGTQKLMLKRVGDFREQPDKSLELWALPPGAPAKSLGVMTGDAVVQLTAADSDIRQSPVLAITLEPKGGVPRGTAATGPILFKGALIKTPD